MKKSLTKTLAFLLLLVSAIFGNLFITQSLSHSVYADEEETGRIPVITAPDNATDPDDLPDVTGGSDDNNDSNTENPDETGRIPAVTAPSLAEEGEDSETSAEEGSEEESTPVCQAEAGSLSWIICPTIEIITNATDAIYKAIEQLLIVQPLSTADDSPIYLIWQYMRSLTNIVFVILLIVVIYSQITGLGISNYGIKRILPRLIITVVLINLSYLICTLAVDLSNIIGFSLRGTLGHIQEAIASVNPEALSGDLSIATIVSTLIGGGTIAGITISALGGIGWLFWMLVPVLIAGIISVVVGLLTIAARQALIALLIMIAPLALVAYLLPNTEKWFTKWKDLLLRMLIFYPMFSFLYGASQLAGWALIAASTNALGIILGLAVQIIPIFLGFSLMKMSGTILGTLNTGLRRVFSPVQHATTGWALGHAEHHRQIHLGYSNASGARLRGFLDKRRDLRELETHNALETRRNRSMTYVYNKSSGFKGYDDKGNMTWRKDPNRQTRNAKTSNYYSTLASNAQAAYNNTLGSYSDHYTDSKSQELNRLHGEAFLDAFAQQHLAQNIAEADQKFLLDRHFAAAANSLENPYEYNRLIKSAAGSLGHNGEAAIMGQVIVNSSAIETRRRSEARIIINKFGIDKTKLRPMLFDKERMDDNGYETDADGNVIEDEMFHLIEYDKNGKPTGYKRSNWQHYLGVHKQTGAEITKEEYDTLTDDERKAYRKVRYFDILNDQKQLVQRVFEDDAGYMKEILRDDIAIADPINRRYETEIGVDPETLAPGMLRRYHSTISGALRETKYKEKDAASNSMLLAQIDRGFVTSKGQLNIAALQSLVAAAKAGDFLRNDSRNIQELTKFISAMNDDDAFAKYFPDEDIMKYRNVNGVQLDGWRLAKDANGKEYWEEINHNDPTITLEDKKNLVRHKIIPKAAAKIISMFNRKVSPTVIDDMKSEKGLDELLKSIAQMAIDNATNQKLGQEPLTDDDINVFDSTDPEKFKYIVKETQKELAQLRQARNGNNPDDDGGDDNSTPPSGGSPRNGGPNNNGGGSGGNGNNSGNGGSTRHNGNQGGGPTPHTHPGVDQFRKRKTRSDEAHEQLIQRNSYETVMDTIASYFDYQTDYEYVADQILGYFEEVENLRPLYDDCLDLVEQYRYDERSTSTEDAIYTMVHQANLEQDRIDDLHDAVIELINNRAELF